MFSMGCEIIFKLVQAILMKIFLIEGHNKFLG